MTRFDRKITKMADARHYFIPGYKILEKLGEGGMGVVYKALDQRLKRHVAIKFLFHKSGANNQQDVNNPVLHEAQRLARVNHPNVVHIYELSEPKEGSEQIHSAIVMEYLEGTTLAKLNKEQLLSQNQKLEYLIQICEGMEAIHKQGLIHGDLKAENVWVTQDNKVKLLDFGLSRDVTGESKNSGFGNSASLSTLTPEFCRGEKLTTKSDLYAFGSQVLYLLTNESVYKGNNIDEQIQRIRLGDLNDGSVFKPSLPSGVAALLNDLLNHNPNKRPEGFHEVRKRLKKISSSIALSNSSQDLTQPFKELHEIRKSNKSTKLRHSLAGISVFVFLLILFFYRQDLAQRELEFVLVLPPEFSSDSTISIQERPMIKSVIDNLTNQIFLNSPNTSLISRSEIRYLERNIKAMGKATGATAILTTNLNCHPQNCYVEIELVDPLNGRIFQRASWSTPVRSAIEIDEIAKDHINKNFSNLTSFALYSQPMSSDSFEKYIKLYNKIKFQPGNTTENFQQLSDMINQERYLYPAYRLYRQTALKLFLNTSDESYLERLKELLEFAPPEYKNTKLYIMDEFYLSLYKEDFERAESILSIMQQREVDNTSLIEFKASYYLKNNNSEKALSLLETALQTRFSAVNLYNLALCHWYLGKPEDAAKTLQQALNISPGYLPAQQTLASVLLLKGELLEAETLLKTLVADKPESSDISNYSLALLLQGKTEESLLYARKAVEKSPNSATKLLNLADAEKLVGNKVVAESIYHRLLKQLVSATDLDSLLIKAQANIHIGNGVDAIRALNKANKISPKNSEVAFISALVYTQQREFTSAIVKIEEALDGGVGSVWFNLPWFRPLCALDSYQTIFSQRSTKVPDYCNQTN